MTIKLGGSSRTSMPARPGTRPTRAMLAFAFDVLAVGLFVAIGRRSHNEGGAVGGALTVAAPFLIALVAAWLVAHLRGRSSAANASFGPVTSMRFGTIAWAMTVIGGMVLRRFAFGRSTAASFIVVAAVFLAVTMIGWRLIATRLPSAR